MDGLLIMLILTLVVWRGLDMIDLERYRYHIRQMNNPNDNKIRKD